MPLTTAANVRLTGGIQEENAYLIWQLADDAALNDEVERRLALASAWLASRAPDYYTGSSTGDTTVDALFTGAEEALTMHYLTMPLKQRKVMGSHFPYDQEGSERFAELIDVEWEGQVENLVSGYLQVGGDAQQPFALPGMGATGTILSTERDSEVMINADILDQAENRPSLSQGSWTWP